MTNLKQVFTVHYFLAEKKEYIISPVKRVSQLKTELIYAEFVEDVNKVLKKRNPEYDIDIIKISAHIPSLEDMLRQAGVIVLD